MNESSEDIKEALQDLESKQPAKEDIKGVKEDIKYNSDKDLSEANLKENKEPKLVDEVKASDLEIKE